MIEWQEIVVYAIDVSATGRIYCKSSKGGWVMWKDGKWVDADQRILNKITFRFYTRKEFYNNMYADNLMTKEEIFLEEL